MTLQRQSQFYKLHISVFDVTYFLRFNSSARIDKASYCSHSVCHLYNRQPNRRIGIQNGSAVWRYK